MSQNVFSAKLSSSLSKEEFDLVVNTMVYPSSTKSWLLHGVSPTKGLNWEFGIESNLIDSFRVNNIGDNQGKIIKFIKIPRFIIRRDIGINNLFSISLAPWDMVYGIGSYGVAHNYIFYRNLSRALYFGLLTKYTFVNLFKSLKSNILNLSLSASRDFNSWQFYLSAGGNILHSKINQNLLDPGVKDYNYSVNPSLTIGFRLYNPLSTSLQLDLSPKSINGSLLFGFEY